jgi:Tol biopolymer transport system component
VKRLSLVLFGFALLATACSSSESSSTTTFGTTTVPSTTGLEGRLLFSRFVEATHTFTGMFTSDPDGANEVEIPLPGPEGGGRWSHSGTEIAVMTVLSDGRVGTAIVASDGAVLRVLEIPDPSLNVSCTVWSLDDSRLACEGWDDTDESRRGIYAVDSTDGGGVIRLTTPPAGMGDLPGDFASNGDLVFKRYVGDEAPGNLMVVGDQGGEPTQLSTSPVEDPGRFSPDGQSVVTAADGRIYVIDLQGAIVYTFSDSGAYLFGPVWSPDGTRIAFSRSAGGPFADIYTSLPDGTDRRQATATDANEIGVDWAVDAG